MGAVQFPTTRRSVLALTGGLVAIGAPSLLTAMPVGNALAPGYQLLLRYEQWLYREHWCVARECGRNPISLLPGGFDPAINAYFSDDRRYADPQHAARVLTVAGVGLAPVPDFANTVGPYIERRAD